MAEPVGIFGLFWSIKLIWDTPLLAAIVLLFIVICS